MSAVLLRSTVLLAALAIGAAAAYADDRLPSIITVESVPMILAPGKAPAARPGSPGTTTLAGFDENGNGVRDDVERWIGATFPRCARYRAALSQVALAVQRRILTTSVTADTAKALTIEEDRALSCFAEASESCPDASIEKFIQFSLLLQNTPERIRAYTNGKRPAIPMEESGAASGCMISLDQLPD